MSRKFILRKSNIQGRSQFSVQEIPLDPAAAISFQYLQGHLPWQCRENATLMRTRS
jgi:hypothetical protein